MKRSCRDCLFCDCCDGTALCEHYAPVDETETTPAEKEENRTKRRAFEKEWRRYAARDDDDAYVLFMIDKT